MAEKEQLKREVECAYYKEKLAYIHCTDVNKTDY